MILHTWKELIRFWCINSLCLPLEHILFIHMHMEKHTYDRIYHMPKKHTSLNAISIFILANFFKSFDQTPVRPTKLKKKTKQQKKNSYEKVKRQSKCHDRNSKEQKKRRRSMLRAKLINNKNIYKENEREKRRWNLLLYVQHRHPF